jgi:hypothetical protein
LPPLPSIRRPSVYGARRDLGAQLPPDDDIDRKRDQRRHQQQQADNRSLVEVLLSDHLLVHVDRQHIEVAADDLGHAEVVDGIGKDDQRRADISPSIR